MNTPHISAIEAALRELVACKDLKEQVENGLAGSSDELAELQAEYERRKPLAWASARMVIDRMLAAAPANDGINAPPIDMVLFCPACGMQHIDKPSGRVLYGDEPITEQSFTPLWGNPPHKSHLCRTEDGGCNYIWRPADVPTNGVASIKTRGKNDSEVKALKRELMGLTKPVQRRPLTESEIDLIAADGMRNAAGGIYATSVYEFAREIERAHGI